jgi:hypothetical protein
MASITPLADTNSESELSGLEMDCDDIPLVQAPAKTMPAPKRKTSVAANVVGGVTVVLAPEPLPIPAKNPKAWQERSDPGSVNMSHTGVLTCEPTLLISIPLVDARREAHIRGNKALTQTKTKVNNVILVPLCRTACVCTS